MGRGGGRAKASGGTMSQDGPLANTQLSLNMTLFQFLQTGYFEKDLLSYCANRLAEYSCIFWLDPTVDANSDAVELHTMAYDMEPSTLTTEPGTEFTKYPSHFISQKHTLRPSGVTLVQMLSEGDPIKGTFLGPISVRKVITSEAGSTLAIVESSRLPVDAVARVILPFLLIVACMTNLFILRSSYRLARKRLPLATYLVYISLLDQLDLLARGIDYLVEAYGGIRLFTAIQFLGRSACQLLPMTNSALRHINASLLVGLSIDTCRMAKQPNCFSRKYRSEWAQNVLILAAILAIAVDCQYLWTFDLSQLETKVLHERVVRNAYECGFSQTAVLSPLFLYYIWPMIDHFWGEILPFGVCILTGLVTLSIHRLENAKFVQDKKNNAALYLPEIANTQTPNGPTNGRGFSSERLDTTEIQEGVHALGLISVANGLFILPRMAYYLTKYAMFSMHYMNRAGGPYWTNYEVQPEHPNLQPMMDTFQRVSRLRAYEAPLEVIESVLRYLGAINIISTAIILTCKVAHVRKDLLIQWLLVRDLLRRKPKEYRIVPSGNAHKVEKAVIEALHKSRTSDRGVELESWGVRPKGIFTKMQNEVTTTEIGLGKREDVGEEKKHSSAGYAKVKLNPMKSAARNNTQEPAIQSHRIYSL